jgi:putative ABC transport system permease protein
MENSLLYIPIPRLAIIFLPVFIVIGIQFKWAMKPGNNLYAIGRMLGQLLLIGYLLTFIFQTNDYRLVLAVLSVMIFFSGWIALRTVPEQRKTLLGYALLSILTGGGITLIIVSRCVLSLDPWYMPRYLIPLAGMIFANAMNCVSLASDRLKSELLNNISYETARNTAFRTALIPTINAFFAVGLVSLPGMMTGQILSGVDPLMAVRYQIMVMCMIFSSAGISTIIFLSLVKKKRGVFLSIE